MSRVALIDRGSTGSLASGRGSWMGAGYEPTGSVVLEPPGEVVSEGPSSSPHAANVNVRTSPRITAMARFVRSDMSAYASGGGGFGHQPVGWQSIRSLLTCTHMRPDAFYAMEGAAPDPRAQPRALGRLALALIATVVAIGAFAFGAYLAYQDWLSDSSQVQAAAPPAEDGSGVPDGAVVVSSSTSSSTTSPATTTTSTEATSVPAPPQYPGIEEAPYAVPLREAQPDAKQLAVNIAYSLTTYDASDEQVERLRAFAPRSGLFLLVDASDPLIYSGSWSRGEVIYPQMGGLTDDGASVMVVTRQTVGSGEEPDFSVVRTLDIRLARGESGWEFDFLSSAGGTFADLDDLALAYAVANDSRIEMPDSARLDIEAGLISPILLEVMADLADLTPYGVVTLATGHPENVYGTERMSHHTIGRAVDIYRVGDRRVVDDHDDSSETRAIVDWLYDDPRVLQVGSPWDLDGDQSSDGGDSTRSFTDAVHQDHIHLAVVAAGDDADA